MYIDETAGGGGNAVAAAVAGATGAVTAGLSGFQAAVVAVSRANEAKALALDPEAVDKMISQLSKMETTLERMSLKSNHLTMGMPLGGGYAEQISAANQKIGEQATDSIPKFQKVIRELIEQLEKSRASYRVIDDATASKMAGTL